ncbi:hypothetical protein B0O80DRAFT_425153 [Mortierella sp. GBAus27b]|nr:hypothetical protein BGX31_000536 [Mortierella sp. GBA43]KAI8356269.1 hypothetical protein B0O80DRAFT_425153 [Mortierella sp. GBAus27b]
MESRVQNQEHHWEWRSASLDTGNTDQEQLPFLLHHGADVDPEQSSDRTEALTALTTISDSDDDSEDDKNEPEPEPEVRASLTERTRDKGKGKAKAHQNQPKDLLEMLSSIKETSAHVLEAREREQTSRVRLEAEEATRRAQLQAEEETRRSKVREEEQTKREAIHAEADRLRDQVRIKELEIEQAKNMLLLEEARIKRITLEMERERHSTMAADKAVSDSK